MYSILDVECEKSSTTHTQKSKTFKDPFAQKTRTKTRIKRFIYIEMLIRNSQFIEKDKIACLRQSNNFQKPASTKRSNFNLKNNSNFPYLDIILYIQVHIYN